MAKEMKISVDIPEGNGGVAKSSSPLHDSARRYDFCGIKALLQRGYDTDSKNEKGQAPIHVLLQDGFSGHLNESSLLQCLQVLIEHKCDVNIKDRDGECPLSLAVSNRFESCAKMLVQNGSITSVKTPKFKRMHSLPTQIAYTMPNVMMEILDSGVTVEQEEFESGPGKSIIKLDWRPVLQYSDDDPTELEKYGMRKRKYTQRETSFLYSLLDIPYEVRFKYLSHPLVSGFLHFKNKMLSKKMRGFQLLMTFFPIFYMVFIYYLYFRICKLEEGEDGDEDGSESSTEKPKYEQRCNEISVTISIQAVLLALVVAMYAGIEVYMQLRVDTRYLRSWRTWVIRVTLIIMGLTLWPALRFKPSYNISWQYPIAALGTFFAWVMFLIQMELVPEVKVYLEMLVSIILSVLKIIILFMPLLIGFYMGFNLMFFKFSNIMSFILMTVDIGAEEYEDLIDKAKDSRIWFEAIAYIFTVAFIVVIAIVFMNFLLGVSIDDIQQLKRNAKIMSLSNKVQSFFIIDLVLPSRYRVVPGKDYTYSFSPTDPGCKFPKAIRDDLTFLVKEKYKYGASLDNCENAGSNNGELDLNKVVKMVTRLEGKINALMEATQAK